MKNLFSRFRLYAFIFLCSVGAVQGMEKEILSKDSDKQYGTFYEDISLEHSQEASHESNRYKVFCSECQDEWRDTRRNYSDGCCRSDFNCCSFFCSVIPDLAECLCSLFTFGSTE